MQNPPIQSAELASSRIGMAKGMPSTSLQDWQKAVTAPLLPQKRRWYDAGGFPYRSAHTKQPRYAPGCLYPSRWLPWLRRCAQRTQVCLKLKIFLKSKTNLKLMIIRVNLQFLYRIHKFNRCSMILLRQQDVKQQVCSYRYVAMFGI
ncbi:Hypothetical_protein [Hexamita inflata]|uniref:Hypothetical_protein n=1 Tax=Hexamita inflata TaxID=28002 RepID=A0ABP1HHM2_9EUKA